LLQQKLRAVLRQKEPAVSMSELVKTEANDGDDVFVEQLGVPHLQRDQSSKFVTKNLFD